MTKIIGIIGPRGSGKTTFAIEAASLLSCSVGIIRVSDVLKDTLRAWRIPATTGNMQLLADAMRNIFGQTVFADAIRKRIQENTADVVLVEGIRGPNVAKVLKDFENTILLYIDAPEKIRYERIANRGEKADELAMRVSTFHELEASKRERELLQLKSQANWVIENVGTKEDYAVSIKDFLVTYSLPIT